MTAFLIVVGRNRRRVHSEVDDWVRLGFILVEIDKMDLHPSDSYLEIRRLRSDPDYRFVVVTNNPYNLDDVPCEEIIVVGEKATKRLSEYKNEMGLRSGELWGTIGEDWVDK